MLTSTVTKHCTNIKENKMGILDRIFTAERTVRLVGKLARRQPMFVSALRAGICRRFVYCGKERMKARSRLYLFNSLQK